MKTNRMKRAPAPLWAPLRSLLSGLEVGESGELRLPIEPPARSPDHVFCQLDETTWGWSYVDEWGGSDYGHQSPPLRPGRYWVPEDFKLSVDPDDIHARIVAFRHGPIKPGVVLPRPRPLGKLHPASTMPAAAARLACSVGEERVEAWCGRCEGSGLVIDGDPEPCHDCGGTAFVGCPTCHGAGILESVSDCPACGGTPPPTWVYPVKRTEVER